MAMDAWAAKSARTSWSAAVKLCSGWLWLFRRITPMSTSRYRRGSAMADVAFTNSVIVGCAYGEWG